MGVDGMNALAPALMKMTRMTSLNLQGAVRHVPSDGVGSLRFPGAADNDLNLEALKALTPALMKMTHMSSLCLKRACCLYRCACRVYGVE